MGLEKSLAGVAFQALGSPISHGGDYGAVCHHRTESGGENPGRTAGFYRAEGDAGRGTPYVDRRKKKRKNYRRECTGSALVPM
jgi:hypothetical protein